MNIYLFLRGTQCVAFSLSLSTPQWQLFSSLFLSRFEVPFLSSHYQSIQSDFSILVEGRQWKIAFGWNELEFENSFLDIVDSEFDRSDDDAVLGSWIFG